MKGRDESVETLESVSAVGVVIEVGPQQREEQSRQMRAEESVVGNGGRGRGLVD